MTTLEKPLTRLCCNIVEKGQQLTATIQPSAEGGELLLHWNGDRKKVGDRTFQLKDLSQGQVTAPKPKGWGTWVPIEQIMSQLNIAPGVDHETANMLKGMMERAALMQDWVETENDFDDFNEFLVDKGRKDLIHLACDDERPKSPTCLHKTTAK